MKYFLIPVIYLTFFTLTASAQNLKLIDLNGNDVTNSIYSDVIDTASLDPFEVDLDVVNKSTNQLSISCSRVSNQIIPLSESYFCWDVCYLPIVSTAMSPLSAAALDTISGSFHAYFRPNYQVGTSVIRYRFANTADANDTASFTIVLYSGTLGIKNSGIAPQNKTINAFPNPASSQSPVNFRVTNGINAYLKITNELGQLVFQKKVQKEEELIQVSLAQFESGIYFYSLLDNNGIQVNKKFVITQ